MMTIKEKYGFISIFSIDMIMNRRVCHRNNYNYKVYKRCSTFSAVNMASHLDISVSRLVHINTHPIGFDF